MSPPEAVINEIFTFDYGKSARAIIRSPNGRALPSGLVHICRFAFFAFLESES
jgi:hypothetical protein